MAPRMDLPTLIENYADEDRCREYLERLRWPEGTRCPRCSHDKVSRVKARKGTTKKPEASRRQFDCDSCRYQFSVTAGTVFHDTHLPLWKWFMATYIMCESKKGVSANQLKRMLGVSYKTAWYLCHRIRSAMPQGEEMLFGVVEVDETYIGGKARSKGKGKGNWRPHKTMVLGAIERDGDVRLRVEHRAANSEVLQGFIHKTVSDSAHAVYTDSHPAYRSLKGLPHESVDHSSEEWIRGEVGTNGIESAWSLLKRSIVGSYHQLSAKHMQAYMDEFAFRFNNRENPFLFRDTMLKLVEADALTYSALTRAQ